MKSSNRVPWICWRRFPTVDQSKEVPDKKAAGEEGIAKIYNFDPKVVLLDVLMPRLTGDELVKMITDWRPEVQVIMITANISPEAKEECMRNGAYAYIQQPVNFDQLAELINEAARKSESLPPAS